jgi:sugar phosphate permease
MTNLKYDVRSSVHKYAIWFCAALFYMYQFILRVSPAVMIRELIDAFQMNASTVGSLSAIAMYAYSCLQVPAGIVTDRFGVRRVILSSLSLCVLGTLLFGLASSVWEAQLGRFLIGAGSSAAFLSSGKVAATYFDSEKRAILFGLTMAAGTLGALNGGAPLSRLVSEIGWRPSVLILAAVGVIVFTLSFFALKNDKTQPTHIETPRKQIQSIRHVLSNPRVWLYALVAVGLYLSISVLADLWGPAFIMEQYQVEKQRAAQSVSLIYVGLLIGSLAIPILSAWIHQRRNVILFSLFGVSILLCVILYGPHLSLFCTSAIFLIIGILAGADMLCFSGACEAVSATYAGTATGIVNGVVMFSVACAQHIVGYLLDYFWKGAIAQNSSRIYSAQEFKFALSILPIITTVSFCLGFRLKDRHLSRNTPERLPSQ